MKIIDKAVGLLGKSEDKGKAKDETIVTKKVLAYDPNLYKGFGEQGEDAYKSGWVYENSPVMGKRVFTNQYGNAFNQIRIPNDGRLGHLALVVGDNGKFDVLVRNADKQPQGQPLASNLTYDQVQKMYGNQLIGNRLNEINKQDSTQKQYVKGAVPML